MPPLVRHALLPCCLLLALLLGACRGEPDLDVEEAERVPSHLEGFGDAYRVELQEADASPEVPPHVANDSLVVHVAYTGGCSDHDFALSFRQRPDTTFLWLHHQAPDDAGENDCRYAVTDALAFPLPPELRGRDDLALRNPEGGPAFEVVRLSNE